MKKIISLTVISAMLAACS
ncbi:lipoprotein [Kingella negevensis]